MTIEEIIENSPYPEVRAQARGILSQIQDFDFLFCLKMLNSILILVVKVSNILQKPEIDLLTAKLSVDSLATALSKLRNDEEAFEQAYVETVEICNCKKISIPAPRNRQISHREDTNYQNQTRFNTCKDEIRVTCYYPLLDRFIFSLKERFSHETMNLIDAMANILNLSENEDYVKGVGNKFNLSSNKLLGEMRLLKNLPCVPIGTTNLILKEWHRWLLKSDEKICF